MVAKLVISLDFELMWGVRDHRSDRTYGDAILGGRRAIPEVLKRFSANKVKATWATVGLLFARSKDDMLDYAPASEPQYLNSALSPYDFIRNSVGKNERDDPLYFGRSLVQQIYDTPGQELATHTYSHYYCLESGQTISDFAADLSSAKCIASDMGVSFKSIVFPRNQMTEEYVKCCKDLGLECFRGNPTDYLYRPRAAEENKLLVRGLRLADSVVPLSRSLSFKSPKQCEGVLNVRASRFLRPWAPSFPLYSKLHLKRIKDEMEFAARAGEIYHLWWHPHNMGRHTEQNLNQLDEIIATYRKLHDKYGMVSVSMSDLASI